MDVVPKVWGREEIICNTILGKGGYCGKRMVLSPGFRCSMHWHKRKDETFLVEHGTMRVELATAPVPSGWEPDSPWHPAIEVRDVGPGQSVHVPAGTLHRFSNHGTEDVVFFEFSTPDDPADSYRIEPSGRIPPA